MRSDNVLKFTRATSAVDQSPRFPDLAAPHLTTLPYLTLPRLASLVG